MLVTPAAHMANIAVTDRGHFLGLFVALYSVVFGGITEYVCGGDGHQSYSVVWLSGDKSFLRTGTGASQRVFKPGYFV